MECTERKVNIKETSCAEDHHNMPRPLQVDNIFVFIRQVAELFRHVGYFKISATS